VAPLLVLLVACGGGGSKQATTTTVPPTTTTAPPTTTATTAPGPTRMRLTKVVELDQPVALAMRPGDPVLYVAEKTGRVRRVRDGRVGPTPLLDLSGQVSTNGERGLLGLAWAPDGRAFYVNYTDRDGDTHVVEYAAPAGDATVAVGTGRELLFVEQPFANHNGGNLVFGPDGMLWIGLGDGGSSGDPGNRAQDLGTLLGKMLRIDPRPSGGLPYTIPADNPFVGRAGARGEIWSYGLRNPWRYSFDRGTGDLWIGDVGQGDWEEIDLARAGSKGGENWGWPHEEGAHRYEGRTPFPGAVRPVHEYSLQGDACAVTGGFVYRGKRLPSLVGQYVFADACIGELRALVPPDWRVRSLDLRAGFVASFAEDLDGELYVLSLDGPVYRLDPA
jgi:glucose/arabinose dehydrogenase